MGEVLSFGRHRGQYVPEHEDTELASQVLDPRGSE